MLISKYIKNEIGDTILKECPTCYMNGLISDQENFSCIVENCTKSYRESELCLQHFFVNYSDIHRASRSLGKGPCLLIVAKKECFYFFRK